MSEIKESGAAPAEENGTVSPAPDGPYTDASRGRSAGIIRTSLIGIFANVLLAAFKAAVGLASNAIAVVLDAVNNLSDALSSLITIAGAKLGAKQPDRKHPMGHGRYEYLSAIVISVIILYAGVTSLIESIRGILHPQTPDYGTVTLVIIAAGVIVKVILSAYVKKMGRRYASESLVASGTDARFDAVLSAATLVAAVIYLKTGVSLEAWLAAVISAVLIKSGIEQLVQTVSGLLGERVDRGKALAVKKAVCSVPGVRGAYDLLLHDYGPDTLIGSVHVEVPDGMTADEIDRITRRIEHVVWERERVLLAAVGIYSYNTGECQAAQMREQIRAAVLEDPDILQMHGFFADPEEKSLRFDIVVRWTSKDRAATAANAAARAEKLFPGWTAAVKGDPDLTD